MDHAKEELDLFIKQSLTSLFYIKRDLKKISNEKLSTTSLSNEGLVTWTKDKLKQLWVKFSNFIKSAKASLFKSKEHIDEKIKECSAHPNKKIKTSVTLGTLKLIAKTSAMVAVGVSHILACTIDPKGNFGISDITRHLATKLNMTIFKIHQDLDKGPWYTSSGDVLTAAHRTVKGITETWLTLRDSSGKIKQISDIGGYADIKFMNVAKASRATASIIGHNSKLYVAKVWK